MFCDAATVAYRVPGKNPETGKHYKPFAFHRYKSDEDVQRLFASPPIGAESVLLPCGKCLLCTKRYRLHWVARCMHELHYFKEACYITLTVSDQHIGHIFPPLSRRESDFDTIDTVVARAFASRTVDWPSLRHKPFQDFLKRLRRQLSYGYHFDRVVDGVPEHCVYRGEPGMPIRYFMCGEYGDLSHRPHYHAIVYGVWPPDARQLPGKPHLFISNLITKLWPFGIHTVERVLPESISYVAGYVDKKMDSARMDWAINDVAPEYVCMSRGCSKIGTGGLGRGFFDDFYHELYPENDDGSFVRDYCIIGKGTRIKLPRYYDDLLWLRDEDKYGRLVAHREQVAVARDVEFDLCDWLNESHRRCAVAVARRRQRDPGVNA